MLACLHQDVWDFVPTCCEALNIHSHTHFILVQHAGILAHSIAKLIADFLRPACAKLRWVKHRFVRHKLKTSG